MTAIDPVCGMLADEKPGVSIDHAGQRLWFCTEFCKEQFVRYRRAKAELLALVRARTGRQLRDDVFTIGFARRATAYKRPELVLADRSRLRAIGRRRPLQIVFAGKAHPKDEPGKASIATILAVA
jgi:glucan phosphorylase